MKTLVKLVKVEDGIVTYQEICKRTGKVMIEDYMTVAQFTKALSDNFGFKLAPMTKAQALKVASSFGITFTNWEYNRPLAKYEASIKTKTPYDNGFGFMVDSLGLNGVNPESVCQSAIIKF